MLAAARLVSGQAQDEPLRSVFDPGVVTTRQTITPAGVQSIFNGRVYGITFGTSSDTVYVALASGTVYKLNWRTNNASILRGHGQPGMQSLALDPVSGTPLLGSSSTTTGDMVQLVRFASGGQTVLADRLGRLRSGGLAIAAERNAAGERDAAVALTVDNGVAVVDLESGVTKGVVKTGIAPFGVAINRKSTVAYVSNWGGRFAKAHDRTVATGNAPNADRVVVDRRGIASTGTLTRVDLIGMRATGSIAVGLHPTGLYWDQHHARLYVANSNSDSISVIDTETNSVVRTILIRPFERRAAGIAPNALAVSPDGETLYVACGGINAVAVIKTPNDHLEGLIPTAWYPNDLRLSPDGSYLAIANLMGVGAGGTPDVVEARAKADHLAIVPGPARRQVNSNRSSIQVVPIPTAEQLIGYTTAAAENNRVPFEAANEAIDRGSSTPPLPVPLRAGDRSLVHHAVLIIKENRTFDQVFGDLKQANSDPSLLVYGRDVTPNHHRLAEQFVVLDNFYASGGNSADGHQWLTQAAESDYCYWQGYAGRGFPFEGSDPIAPVSSGFLWDAALARKRTVLDFGEYAAVPANPIDWHKRAGLLAEWKRGVDFSRRFHTVAPLASVDAVLDRDYPYWTLAVPDVVRAKIFLKHLRAWETSGQMPNLVIVQLPADHTFATTPDFSTPKAAVADNDLALGRIVEGLTKSAFWKSMAILVVEDDASYGIDHVDGHRTVALAISPYIRRGSVDSTFYSHPSMLKTIELMLRLPTLSLFDLIANDMRNSFQLTPDFRPYEAVTPKQSLFEVNPPVKALTGEARRAALASMRMDFAHPDAAPSEIVNPILWRDGKGWGSRLPRVKQAAFVPYSIDGDEK